MLNFDFYNPTHIVFGEGRLEELNNLVPQNSKILITYGGGSVKRFGVLDRVKDELSKGSRKITMPVPIWYGAPPWLSTA